MCWTCSFGSLAARVSCTTCMEKEVLVYLGCSSFRALVSVEHFGKEYTSHIGSDGYYPPMKFNVLIEVRWSPGVQFQPYTLGSEYVLYQGSYVWVNVHSRCQNLWPSSASAIPLFQHDSWLTEQEKCIDCGVIARSFLAPCCHRWDWLPLISTTGCPWLVPGRIDFPYETWHGKSSWCVSWMAQGQYSLCVWINLLPFDGSHGPWT